MRSTLPWQLRRLRMLELEDQRTFGSRRPSELRWRRDERLTFRALLNEWMVRYAEPYLTPATLGGTYRIRSPSGSDPTSALFPPPGR